MSESTRSFSSVFDELLERDKKQLDALLDGTLPPLGSRATGTARVADTSRTPKDPTPPTAPTATPSTVPSSVAQELDARFGTSGWRHHVRERRIENGEAVVLCELAVPEQGITKTQFGHALVTTPGDGDVTGTTTSGLRFSLGGGKNTDHAHAGTGEEDAIARAIENALRKCAALL